MRCSTCHFNPCRCEDLRQGFSKAQAAKGSWPLLSDAAGVHPSQIEEARQESRRLGVPVEYAKNGQAIFESEAHRRKYLRRIGMVDRNSFYS